MFWPWQRRTVVTKTLCEGCHEPLGQWEIDREEDYCNACQADPLDLEDRDGPEM